MEYDNIKTSDSRRHEKYGLTTNDDYVAVIYCALHFTLQTHQYSHAEGVVMEM